MNGTRYNRYGSLNDSVSDQGTVLSTRPRYAKAMKLASDPKAFLSAVAKAGWSSSTTYVSSVYKLISRYGLTKFDLNISTTLTKGGRGAKVTALQHLLNNAGQKVSTTGYFGTSTVAAVKTYQKRQGLQITGRADPLPTLTRITPDVTSGAKGSRVASGGAR